jgi:molybdopterin-guanine dinucleotide biosynthesis protein A
MSIPAQYITGLLLAGGQGTRMGGRDKGLQTYRGEPLALHVLRRLTPQAGTLLISANRHLDAYRQFGADVVTDAYGEFEGPLAGMQAGLVRCTTPWLLSVPCDSPFLPLDLAQRLADALIANNADLAYAVTGPDEGQTNQVHPVFSLMRSSLRDDLARYLQTGARKVREWQASVKAVAVPFADEHAFRNLNTIADLDR